MKTSLTFEEKVIAVAMHYAHGIDQHVIAMAMGVNPGRVAEACVAVREVLNANNVTRLKDKSA